MHKLAGYSNYWTYVATPENPDGGFTPAQWSKVLAETRKIIAAAEEKGIKVAGPSGSGLPVLDNDHIALNGANPDDYETFHLNRIPSAYDKDYHVQMSNRNEVASSFCKTNGKPYDAVVASILSYAARVSKRGLSVHSDGGRMKRILATEELLAKRVAARYPRDPFWMEAKYPGKDKNGKPFPKGTRVFYYPLTKTILTGEEAEQAARDFNAASFDEDFGFRAAGSAGRDLPSNVRKRINAKLIQEGLDGNGRFIKPEQGYVKAVDVLMDFGVVVDGVVPIHLFGNRPTGSVRISVGFADPTNSFTVTPIRNSVLFIQYTELRPDAFEVVAYMS